MGELLENLSDLEHQQWSHMMKFFLGLDVQTISKNVLKWNNQANTDYKDLSEEDKEKDRVFARKVVELIAQEISKHRDCKVMHDLGKHGKGEMTCLDKVLESLGYTKELNGGKKFFSSQP
jgi:hypothetical protein